MLGKGCLDFGALRAILSGFLATRLKSSAGPADSLLTRIKRIPLVLAGARVVACPTPARLATACADPSPTDDTKGLPMPSTVTLAPSQGPAAARIGWRKLPEFFAYHGVWAIGVRLMRVWSLRTKMVLLVAVLALPLLPLMAAAILERNAALGESARRLAGLQTLDAAYALARQLDTQRQALESHQPVPTSQAAPALKALQATAEAAQRAGVDLSLVLRRHQPALKRAVAEADDLPALRLEALKAARLALGDIRSVSLQHSHLLLTPDPQQDALANLATERLPALHRELAMLSGHALRLAGLVEKDARPGADLHAAVVALAGSTESAERLMQQCEGLLNVLKGSPWLVGEASLGVSRLALGQVRAGVLAASPVIDLPALHRGHAQAVQQIVELQQRLNERLGTRLVEQQADARRQRDGLLAALALTLALAAYLIYSFFLVMRGGLDTLDRQMTRMAQGDLSARPMPRGGDEVARVMQALTVSLARLSDLLASVRQGVGAIAQASTQMAEGNAELAGRSQRTSQGMDTLGAQLTAYTQALQACTRAVESVVTTVQALRLASVRNRRQMQRLQERMGSLRGKSREIGEIVSLIDTIAFRTNILALNASVEACKAGEAGRGFSVVAQEVRALATRSADSARRISRIVTSSTQEIEHSAALADETGRSIAEADGHAEAIHQAMTTLAGLTHRGDCDAADLLQQIGKLGEQSAENQALVMQLASASESLRGQGDRLAQRVGLFKLS